MRFKIFYLFFVILLTGCVRNEYIENMPVEKRMVITAYTDCEEDTKTTLDGEVGSVARKVLWDVKDSIGIVSQQGSSFNKFVNIQTEESIKGLFEGMYSGGSCYAVYPYNKNFKLQGTTINLSLPEVQEYEENSFGLNCSPMVARKSTDEDLKFKNLCGVLVLRMTGNFSVKSITFTAKDSNGEYIRVSGGATVDMAYIRTPELIMAADASTKVVLDCNSGVQLNAAESVPFHIVLPVGTYNTFSVVVASTDGRIYIKEGTKPLTIKRSIATKSSDFTPSEEQCIDLSLRGTSNCYIVSKRGAYSFDASVIGNGESGIIDKAIFHTDTPRIEPENAEILWVDKEPMISSVILDNTNNRVSFFYNGDEGNGVIAVKDSQNNILWSWHIWCTDLPKEQIYPHNAGVMMDRNLGATSTTPGELDAYGLFYQWGRKDPFVGSNSISSSDEYLQTYPKFPDPIYTPEWGNVVNGITPIHRTILDPMEFYVSYNGDWDWFSDAGSTRWSIDKTIYDPCPVGWRVPDGGEEGVWNRAGLNIYYTIDPSSKGVLISLSSKEGDVAWYPAPGYRSSEFYGGIHNVGTQGYYWSVTPFPTLKDYIKTSSYVFSLESSISDGSFPSHTRANGLSVRCMKDEFYSDISLPSLEINNIDELSPTEATINVNVISNGKSQVLEQGVIIGTVEGITLNSGVSYKSDMLQSNYTITINNLSAQKKYYIRAYAINQYGVGYSAPSSFYLNEEDIIELGVEENANSYIISSPGRYKFKAVIGNSDVEIRNIYDVDVVWESYGTSTAPETGDLVNMITYNGGYVHIETNEAFNEGNALVAVKDNRGDILWSWHLWFTDIPKEEIYLNKAGVLMDRNLGATSSTPGDVGTLGLLYQWGRKDPFLGSSSISCSEVSASTITWPSAVMTDNNIGTIEYSIKHPTVFIKSRADNFDWCANSDATRWTVFNTQKSIYDPCPSGWRVPDIALWQTAGFVEYVHDSLNHGYKFPIVSSATTWYPTTGFYSIDGSLISHGGCWSTFDGGGESRCLFIYVGDLVLSYSSSKARAYSVRCQKIE